MGRLHRILLIIGLCLLNISCANPVGMSALGESGVEGRVLRGPMCPVVRADQPCPDQPFSARFLVFDGSGTLTATFRSDEQGRFRVLLTPGAYTIIPDESAPIIHPTGQRKAVQVSENEFTQVTLIFDTGIR